MSRYWPLRFLIIIFVIPVVGAALALANPNLFKFKLVSYGTLIQPTLKIQTKTLEFSPHKWHVLYLEPANCDNTCQLQKEKLAKLHIALGADQSRVKSQSIHGADLNFTASDQSVLIVDPQGWYVMQYEHPNNFSGILKDLRRLLKYSHDTFK